MCSRGCSGTKVKEQHFVNLTPMALKTRSCVFFLGDDMGGIIIPHGGFVLLSELGSGFKGNIKHAVTGSRKSFMFARDVRLRPGVQLLVVDDRKPAAEVVDLTVGGSESAVDDRKPAAEVVDLTMEDSD